LFEIAKKGEKSCVPIVLLYWKKLAICFGLWYNERIQNKEMLIGHSSLHKNHVIMKRRKELW